MMAVHLQFASVGSTFADRKSSRRIALAAVAQSMSGMFGTVGARLYLLRQLASGAITARAALLHVENTFTGPTPALITADDDIGHEFWAHGWSHDGENSMVESDRNWPKTRSLSADWTSSAYCIVMAWGDPQRGMMMCRRAVGVTIQKADHRTLLDQIDMASEITPAAMGTYDDAVMWCLEWMEAGRGRNSDKAFAFIVQDSRFDEISRDVFRMAWKDAKMARKPQISAGSRPAPGFSQ